MTKTECRFFTIADYIEEENWLREQHNAGWKFVKFTVPCFFLFESCEPEDVIYRLDFKNSTQTDEYMQMCSDFGWEYAGCCIGWLYFRKPASEAANEDDCELFSDNQSRVDMLSQIIKTRLFPVCVIFLCCVAPNLMKALDGEPGRFSGFFLVFFGVMFVLYVYLIVHCGRKLKYLKEKYELK